MNQDKLAQIFNLWAKRYSKNPEGFSNILDEDGQPIEDYGKQCSIYFEKLSKEVGEL